MLARGYILTGTFLKPGSLVFLGTLADWKALPTYPALPTEAQGGVEVLACNTTPDLKAQENLYEAYV